MGKSDSPIYWCRSVLNNNHYSCETADRINQWLVEFFEDLLKMLEFRGVKLSDGVKSRYIGESMHFLSSQLEYSSKALPQTEEASRY
jgi:hypothetical protein